MEVFGPIMLMTVVVVVRENYHNCYNCYDDDDDAVVVVRSDVDRASRSQLALRSPLS